MAEALVAVILQQLASVVQLDLDQEVRLVVGVSKQIKNLAVKLKIIQAVLSDAEEKQIKDDVLKVWLEELKDVAYEMEDVLDEWSTEIHRSETERSLNGYVGKKVCTFSPWYCFKQVKLRRDIGSRIKEINERMNLIAYEKDGFHLSESRKIEEPYQRMTSSIVDLSEVCGRDIDKLILLNNLLDESTRKEMGIPILGVVGMGGLGKTTLAQVVFNSVEVRSHFEKRMWVCVSEPFDKVRLAKAIIEAVGDNVQSVIEWEPLHQQLCNSVKGKKFLLVLDDVWTEDYSLWSPLRLSLNGGAPGSRILVTTRHERVAMMMGSTYTHNLQQLSEEHCWLLFSNISLVGREEEERGRLEPIGKEIIMKCKGVPLFIKTLGSLLRFKRTRKDWEDVLESDTWELPEVEKGVLPALLLSYYALPSHLKRCFTYCAKFPKDLVIDKDMLIKLWMAQGFLISKGRRDMETIGEENFNDLVLRSFFQDIEKDNNGNIIYCKMHDLVHDFAQFLTRNESIVLDTNDAELHITKVRYLTAQYLNADFFFPSIFAAKHLRSLDLHVSASFLPPLALPNLFSHLKSLRALFLSIYDLGEDRLPNEVEKLIHLRYLSLPEGLIEMPAAASNLYNLQTLDLDYCSSLQRLPEGMEKLVNLRHLLLESTKQLSYFPKGFGRLTSLRTLPKFIVSCASGGCAITELKDLNLLQGNLEIQGLHGVTNASEANEARMMDKPYIRSLILNFGPQGLENDVGDEERLEAVLEGLRPHTNLEKLQIQYYLGYKWPSWFGNNIFANLLTVCLVDCKKCQHIPMLGRLPSLQTLEIVKMDEVKRIGVELFGDDNTGGSEKMFLKLKELKLTDMRDLEEFDLKVKDQEILPNLRQLSLRRCPKLKLLPSVGNLSSLEILDLRGMQTVQCVGVEFLECSNVNVMDGAGKESKVVASLANLKELKIGFLIELLEWKMPGAVADISIMPYLHTLYLFKLTKLKTLPDKIFPPSLRDLSFEGCPELTWTPNLPLLLEKLTLYSDVGILSKSLPVESDNKYLKALKIVNSPHLSLPKGLAHFIGLESMLIDNCSSLQCMPEEFQCLTGVQELTIKRCSILGPRCRKGSGEDWNIISHVSTVFIDEYREI